MSHAGIRGRDWTSDTHALPKSYQRVSFLACFDTVLNDSRCFPRGTYTPANSALVVFPYPASVTSCRFSCRPYSSNLRVVMLFVDLDRIEYLCHPLITINHGDCLSETTSRLPLFCHSIISHNVNIIRS